METFRIKMNNSLDFKHVLIYFLVTGALASISSKRALYLPGLDTNDSFYHCDQVVSSVSEEIRSSQSLEIYLSKQSKNKKFRNYRNIRSRKLFTIENFENLETFENLENNSLFSMKSSAVYSSSKSSDGLISLRNSHHHVPVLCPISQRVCPQHVSSYSVVSLVMTTCRRDSITSLLYYTIWLKLLSNLLLVRLRLTVPVLLLLPWTVVVLLLCTVAMVALSGLIVVVRLTPSTSAELEVDVPNVDNIPDIDNNTDNNCDYNLYTYYHVKCHFYSPQEISHGWLQVSTLVATDPIRLQLITTMFINTHILVCGLCLMISVRCDDVQPCSYYQMSVFIDDVLRCSVAVASSMDGNRKDVTGCTTILSSMEYDDMDMDSLLDIIKTHVL